MEDFVAFLGFEVLISNNFCRFSCSRAEVTFVNSTAFEHDQFSKLQTLKTNSYLIKINTWQSFLRVPLWIGHSHLCMQSLEIRVIVPSIKTNENLPTMRLHMFSLGSVGFLNNQRYMFFKIVYFWTYAHPSYCPSDLLARGLTAARWTSGHSARPPSLS